MKLLVFVSICVCISRTEAVATAEVKTKMPTKLVNSIPIPQKQELYYAPAPQVQAQNYIPVQLMQKPVIVAPHHQPHTMLIIAQPAYVPQNVLYGGNSAGMQQLLNYFHGNPQAKYQLLYGGYQPHPTHQTYVAQAPVAAPTVAAYQVVQNPGVYNHLMAAPGPIHITAPIHPATSASAAAAAAIVPQLAYPSQPQAAIPAAPAQMDPQQHIQPLQLNQIANYAQMTAHQFGLPIRSAPPIITGLENFTPEQQAQIKAQLGSHLGAPITTAATLPATTSQYSQYPQQLTTQQPSQNLNSNEYAQNQDKNGPQTASSNYSPSLVYRAQYTKG